jgi:hypothetical protein
MMSCDVPENIRSGGLIAGSIIVSVILLVPFCLICVVLRACIAIFCTFAPENIKPEEAVHPSTIQDITDPLIVNACWNKKHFFFFILKLTGRVLSVFKNVREYLGQNFSNQHGGLA